MAGRSSNSVFLPAIHTLKKPPLFSILPAFSKKLPGRDKIIDLPLLKFNFFLLE